MLALTNAQINWKFGMETYIMQRVQRDFLLSLVIRWSPPSWAQ